LWEGDPHGDHGLGS